MSRLLVCVFTFNRPDLLRNCVRSVVRDLPGCDGVVFDDGSWVPGAREALDAIARDHAGWSYRVRERGGTVGLQGLYRNMADALQRAADGGYEHCLFIEDDTQLVWPKPAQLDELDALFDRSPDAVQVQPLLYRRIHNYSAAMEYVRSARMYRCITGFNTTAFWNLRAVREHADYTVIHEHRGSNLALNSAYWLRAGYRVYADATPNMGIIPWVRSHSAAPWETTGLSSAGAAAGDGLLLEPTVPDPAAVLAARPGGMPALQEHFAQAGHDRHRPIWHRRGELMEVYYARCRRLVEEEDAAGTSPIGVETVEDTASCRLGPSEGHLNWQMPASSARPLPERRPLRKRVTARLPRALKAGGRQLAAELRARANGDYRGYRELCRRLQAEQRALQQLHHERP